MRSWLRRLWGVDVRHRIRLCAVFGLSFAAGVGLLAHGLLSGVAAGGATDRHTAASDGDFRSVCAWEQLEGDHVTLYCPPSKNPIETELALRGSDAMLDRICRLLKVEPPPFKVGVYLFPHGDLYDQYVLEKGQPYGTSYAFSRSVAMLDDTWARNRTNVAHELSHVIIDFRLTSHAPGLIEEGFATYIEEETTGAPDGVSRDPVSPLPLRRLASSSTFYDWDQAERSSDQYGYYSHYAHAGGFVRYMVDRFGVSRFEALYRAIDADDDPDESECVARSVEQVYGVSLETLETSWRRTARARPPRK